MADKERAARFGLTGQVERHYAWPTVNSAFGPVEEKVVDRYFVYIVDRRDGQVKVLSVGKVMMQKLIEAMEKPLPKPGFWKRLWTWLCTHIGLLRRFKPKEPDYDFLLWRRDDHGYEVERVPQ